MAPNRQISSAGVGRACWARVGSRVDRVGGQAVERVKGIEPSYEAWEAAVLPLNYTRKGRQFTRLPHSRNKTFCIVK